MFNGISLHERDENLTGKQKAYKRSSYAELEEMIKTLEFQTMSQPLMFIGKDGSPSSDKLQDLDGFPPPEPINIEKRSYMHPTVSSSLPAYLHGEIERVRNSYRTATFWSVKKLPDKLEPGEVLKMRRQHVVDNLVQTSANVFRPASLLRAHDFGYPLHHGTDYDKLENLHKIAVEEEKMRIDSYSRKPFVVSSRNRAKFEDIFNDEFQYPDMGPGGNVIHKLGAITRSDVQQSDKFIHGRFLAAHKHGSTSSSQDMRLVRTWVNRLHHRLMADWPQFSFRIRFLPSQELVIQFVVPATLTNNSSGTKNNFLSSSSAREEIGMLVFPPPNNALGRYMLQLATHGIAAQCGLLRRGDRWATIERDYASNTPLNTLETAGDGANYNNIDSSLDNSTHNIKKTDGGSIKGIALSPVAERGGTGSNTESEANTPGQSSARRGVSFKNNDDETNLSLYPPPLGTTGSSYITSRNASTLLATMDEEEASQHSSNENSVGMGTQPAAYTDFLTYSFYAPWVNSRQFEAAKSYGTKDRLKAREWVQRINTRNERILYADLYEKQQQEEALLQEKQRLFELQQQGNRRKSSMMMLNPSPSAKFLGGSASDLTSGKSMRGGLLTLLGKSKSENISPAGSLPGIMTKKQSTVMNRPSMAMGDIVI